MISRCHPSRSAEIYIGGGVNGENLACSGGMSATYTESSGRFKPGLDFYDDGAGREGQALMLQRFAASHHVTMVAVANGGNDFDFADIVQSCVLDFLASPAWLPDHCDDDSSVTADFTAANVAAVRARMAQGLRKVARAMTNAGYSPGSYKIVVQDYPSPIPDGAGFRYPESGYTRQSVAGCGFWNADADWADSTAVATIDGTVSGAVADSGLSNVVMMHLAAAFEGRTVDDARLTAGASPAGHGPAGSGGAPRTPPTIESMTTAQGKANGQADHPTEDDDAANPAGEDTGRDAADTPDHEPAARPDLPWTGRPQRADLICWGGIALSGLYALALIPVRPLLIGHHPVLLELLTGSMTSIVTAGAFARVGEVPLVLAVTAAIPGMIVFDPFFWWAGRRWGGAVLTIFAGRSRRGARLVGRAEKWGRRLGWLGVVLAYYLPIPAALVFIVAGWTGMRLVTFVLLDALGALLWIGLLAGLGYYLGQDAVDVAKTISHYGLWISIGLVVAVVISQRVKTMRAPAGS